MKQTRHLIRTLMAAVVMLLAWLVPQGAWALSGHGTPTDPYKIEDSGDWVAFWDIVTHSNQAACAKVIADFSLSDHYSIGYTAKPYTGTFDGNDHTITVNDGFRSLFDDCFGLFGCTDGANIKNLSIAGTMTPKRSTTTGVIWQDNIGTAVGWAKGNTKIQNVHSSVNINIDNGIAKNHIGGIAGNIEGTTVVIACTYSGTMNVGASSDSNGGIVGFAHASCSGSIQYCFCSGTVKTTASSPVMGGILGYTNDESKNFGGVQNCFSCATLTYGGSKASYVNGIVGRIRARATTTINNYFVGSAEKACNADGPSIPTSNQKITISVTADANGSVSQSYVNPTSTTATKLHVEATPKTGYHFTKWSDNITSTTHEDVALTDNVNLTASFAAHTYGDAAWTWASDGKSASAKITCTTCGNELSGNAAITSKVKTAATCTAKGSTTYTANVTLNGTQYSSTKDVDIAMLNHNMTSHAATAATCTATGNLLYYTCSRSCCAGKYYKDNDAHTTNAYTNQAATVIAALGHGTIGYTPTYTWGGTHDAATCTFSLKCKKCNSNVVSNQSLTPSKVDEFHKDATCTADGNERWTATGNYSKSGDASYNGTLQAKNYAIPALGHSMTPHAYVAPTCTTEGNEAYWTCSRSCCKDKYFKDADGTAVWGKLPTLSALGHQWENGECTICHAFASETIAYTGTSGTCTWSIYVDGTMIVEPTSGETGTLGNWKYVDENPWFAYRKEIKSVKFRGEVRASTCLYMFGDCSNLTSIDFSGFNTEDVVLMDAMFEGCSALESLDLSGFNTAKVRIMEKMFYDCSDLESVDLSSFNTANVTHLNFMFEGCSDLKSLDLSGFNTENTLTMGNMFFNCFALAELKLSTDFVLRGVYKYDMFQDAGKNAQGGVKIYYVIDPVIQNALYSGTTISEDLLHISFVESALVKDGVPFKMTDERGADIPAENVVFTRTFTVGKPASAMLPFTVAASQISGATFYEFKGVKYENNEWVATMQDVSTIEAYKPYVVITTGAGITFHDGSVRFPQTPDASAMITTDDETGWTFVALNEFKRWEAGDEEIGKAYGFAGKDKDYDDYSVAKGEFVKVAAGASAKPGRCYLVKNDGEPLTRAAEELPATIKVRFITGSSNGIGTLNTETGEMTLEGWYDLNGNRIDEPSKGGIYIHNNKKVMVK